MTTKKTTTMPAVLTSDNIPQMLQQVKDQIKAITGGEVKSDKTTGSLPTFGRIQDIKTLDNIVTATSVILAKAKAYKEATTLVVPQGVKKPTFKIDGMTESAMITHLQSRAIEVGKKEQIDVLKKIQKELEDNLTAEQKKANSLARIQDLLKAQQ